MKKSIAESVFFISGGGTGGHIYPALAIAEIVLNLGAKSENIYYIGNKNKQEGEILKDMPYNFVHIPTIGMPRKLTPAFIKFLVLLALSMCKTFLLYASKKPVLAIGTGGFVTFPALWPAKFFGTKSIIHEQNSYPGIVNKLLAKNVNIIFTGFSKYGTNFPASKVVVSGNPIRNSSFKPDFYLEKFFEQHKIDYSKKDDLKKIKDKFGFVILVFGGSSGAKKINAIFSQYCIKQKEHIENSKTLYIWITGKGLYDTYKNQSINNVYSLPYCTDMHTLYGITDFAIARSGAMTVSELIKYKIPALLIPFPFASEDHQYHNAVVLKETGCADVVREEELTDNNFSDYMLAITEKKATDKKNNYASFSDISPNKIIQNEIQKILNS